jgi:cation-dependent mannose-6-phosphate receptor
MSRVLFVLITSSQQSSELKLRGRRLVLQYTNGSPCGENKKRSSWDDDEEDGDKKKSGLRRKSSIISFHCDKDPLAKEALVTFVGTDPDECSYHFEVLSKAACITAEPAKQTVGPGAVFAIIGVIAILVYFLGGVFYQRNVAHARGWRQLPNYSMWAGIGSFIKVSAYTCLQRSKQRVFPRVTSVRDGILPTMEVRPTGRKVYHKSYLSSRSSWEATHLS